MENKYQIASALQVPLPRQESYALARAHTNPQYTPSPLSSCKMSTQTLKINHFVLKIHGERNQRPPKCDVRAMNVLVRVCGNIPFMCLRNLFNSLLRHNIWTVTPGSKVTSIAPRPDVRKHCSVFMYKSFILDVLLLYEKWL